MKMFRKDEGFTLVELMVVVLIIGILVAIAIPVFNAASASARKSACISNQRTLDGATEQWVAANPANDKTTGLGTMANAKAKMGTTQLADGSTGLYVKDWDKSTSCPSNNASYTVAAGDFSCPSAVTLGHQY